MHWLLNFKIKFRFPFFVARRLITINSQRICLYQPLSPLPPTPYFPPPPSTTFRTRAFKKKRIGHSRTMYSSSSEFASSLCCSKSTIISRFSRSTRSGGRKWRTAVLRNAVDNFESLELSRLHFDVGQVDKFISRQHWLACHQTENNICLLLHCSASLLPTIFSTLSLLFTWTTFKRDSLSLSFSFSVLPAPECPLSLLDWSVWWASFYCPTSKRIFDAAIYARRYSNHCSN